MPLGEDAPADVPDHWLADFWVADVDAVAAKTEELGGRVLQQPEAFPGTPLKSGVIADPEGATLSVTQLVIPA
jgi:predicted enzyme related to lactoylglutathione lyase